MPVLAALLIGCGLTVNAQLFINELMLSDIDCRMNDLKVLPISGVEMHNTYSAPCLPDASTARALPGRTVPAHGCHIVLPR